MLPHLWSLWTVELLPQEDAKVAKRQHRPKDVAHFVLQGGAGQQGVVEDGVVEDGDDLHVLCGRGGGDAECLVYLNFRNKPITCSQD